MKDGDGRRPEDWSAAGVRFVSGNDAGMALTGFDDFQLDLELLVEHVEHGAGTRLGAQDPEDDAPLTAYIGTFSSPLQDVLPTQVDLPPGNGRGIHCFRVDRASGALLPDGVVEMGTSPSCLADAPVATMTLSARYSSSPT